MIWPLPSEKTFSYLRICCYFLLFQPFKLTLSTIYLCKSTAVFQLQDPLL